MTNSIIVEKWFEENLEMVKKYVEDPEKILTSAYGKKKGVYLVSVKLVQEDKLLPMYAGEAGADDEHDRSIADRMKEHLHNWLGNYTEYWTGVKEEELANGEMKFHLHIVGEANKVKERKEMETDTIFTVQPYLQYGPYKKYDAEYDGEDLCIIPFKGTRRKALVQRAKQEGVIIKDKTSFVDRILSKDFHIDWNAVKMMNIATLEDEKREAFEKNKNLLEDVLKPSTEEYKRVKKMVDTGLGVKANSRGCTYPYLIKVLSYVLM